MDISDVNLQKNCCVIPKKDHVHVSHSYLNRNIYKSNEYFDLIKMDMVNCELVIFSHMTNYKLCDLPQSVFIHSTEGKFLNIIRVNEGRIYCQVQFLEIHNG